LANLSLGSVRSDEQIAYENQYRRANWEAGQIDYLGQDSFDNILKKIQDTIEKPPTEVIEERERKRSRTPQPVEQPIAQTVAEPVETVPAVVEKAPTVAAPEPEPAPKSDLPVPPKKKEVRKRK